MRSHPRSGKTRGGNQGILLGIVMWCEESEFSPVSGDELSSPPSLPAPISEGMSPHDSELDCENADWPDDAISLPPSVHSTSSDPDISLAETQCHKRCNQPFEGSGQGVEGLASVLRKLAQHDRSSQNEMLFQLLRGMERTRAGKLHYKLCGFPVSWA